MATDYRYRAVRKSDGLEIHSGTITDIGDAGMGMMATTLRSGLIESHELAKGLKHEDIDIEISRA